MRRSSPRSRRSWPHSAQNRAPDGTSARQLGQVTVGESTPRTWLLLPVAPLRPGPRAVLTGKS